MVADIADDVQGEGKPFGPRVPVDDSASTAPAMARLAALSGRDPLWTVDDRAAFLYVGSMRVHPGRREEVVALLTAAPVDISVGCTSYVVATDPTDDDLVWVSETWLSRRHHAASLRLPAAREAIEKAMPLLTGEFTGRRLDVRPEAS